MVTQHDILKTLRIMTTIKFDDMVKYDGKTYFVLHCKTVYRLSEHAPFCGEDFYGLEFLAKPLLSYEVDVPLDCNHLVEVFSKEEREAAREKEAERVRAYNSSDAHIQRVAMSMKKMELLWNEEHKPVDDEGPPAKTHLRRRSLDETKIEGTEEEDPVAPGGVRQLHERPWYVVSRASNSLY